MARWWAEQHTSFNPLWLQKENWLMDNHLPTFKADLNKLTLGCHNKHLFRTTTAFQVALKKEWRRSLRIKLIARPIWLLDGSGVDGVMRQYKRWSVSEEWGVNTEHTQSRQEERVLAPKLSLLCLAILHLYTSSYILHLLCHWHFVLHQHLNCVSDPLPPIWVARNLRSGEGRKNLQSF